MTMTVAPTSPPSMEHAGRVTTPPPDPEFRKQARRRSFTSEYRMRIVREADACTQPGQIGALLRREGLHSSHLVEWRRMRDRATADGLAQVKRGPQSKHPLEVENTRLRVQVDRLQRDLAKAQVVIDVQGKLSALLGIGLDSAETPD